MANKEINIVIKAIDEATKTIKGIGDWLSWFAEKNKATFAKMAVWGTVAFGAITASVLSASTALWQNADRLLDLQAITWLSTKKLQEYQHIQRAAWVSTEALSKAATQLWKKFYDLQDDSTAAGYAMVNLGVQVRNTDSSIRDTGDVLEDTIKALSWVENEMERNNLAFNIFGKSYEDLIPIMALGEKWFNQLQQEANELWLVMWDDALNAANEFRIAQETLTATTEGLKNSLATAMIPILQTMIDKLQPIITSFLSWISNNQELAWWIVTIAWSLAWLVAVFWTLWLIIPSIISWFSLFASAIGVVWKALMFLAANPVWLVITAIWLLVFGIVMLVKHWDMVKQKAMEVWQRIIELYEQHKVLFAIFAPLIAIWIELIKNWETIKTKAHEFWQAIVNTWQWVQTWFLWFVETTSQWGTNLIDMIVSWIVWGYEKVKWAVVWLADTIKDFLWFWSPTKDWPWANSDTWIPNLIWMLTKWFSDGESKIQTSVEKIARKMSEWLSKWVDVDVIKKQVAGFQQSAVSMFDSITSKMSQHKWNLKQLSSEYKDLQNQLVTIKQSILDIQAEGSQSIAQRAVAIESERADIQAQLANWASSMTEQETLALQAKLQALDAEYALATANATNAEIVEARRQSTLSETEKIIEQTAEKVRQAEIERWNIMSQMTLKKKQMVDEAALYYDLNKQKKKLDDLYFTAFDVQIQQAQAKVEDTIKMLRTMISLQASADWWGSSGWISWTRAVGWPVQSWKTYLVGERWPEMFTPATSWSITPNNQMSWGWTSININMWGVTVTNEADEQRLAQTIIQEITRQTQLFNLWIN